MNSDMKPSTPASQLREFISRFSPTIASRARAILSKMRARYPGATELVYDNYNALVIGFGPSERASEAVFSIALYPRWVTLFFLEGAGLPDPEGILQGSGHIVRHIVLDDETVLDQPAVMALMAEAVKRAEKPFVRGSKNHLVIRSISTKQRPRRPPIQTPRSGATSTKGTQRKRSVRK